MGRTRTISMTPDKEALYRNARNRAQQIVDACDAILNDRITEAAACKKADLQVNSFRNFYKRLNERSAPEDKVFITDEDWGDWREDLLFQITGKRIPAPDDFDDVFADICKTQLSERQSEILRMYLDGCNLEEIGKKFGVTRERIRQVEAKIFRILKKPTLRRRLEYGEEYMQALSEHKSAQAAYDLEAARAETVQKLTRAKELSELKAETAKLNEQAKMLHDTTSSVSDIELIMSRTSLDDLDLSVRSYNCLRRHFGPRAITAYDVSLLSLDQLMHVRNLGRKSMEEIISTMFTRFGFTFK